MDTDLVEDTIAEVVLDPHERRRLHAALEASLVGPIDQDEAALLREWGDVLLGTGDSDVVTALVIAGHGPAIMVRFNGIR